MKGLYLGFVAGMLGLLLGCGNSHPRLMSIVVSPSTAVVMMSSSRPMVTFTAMGRFDNNTTRVLTAADGVTWTSSDTTVAAIAMNGMATCMMPGVTNIKATMLTSATNAGSMSMGMGTTTMLSTLTGMAALTCM